MASRFLPKHPLSLAAQTARMAAQWPVFTHLIRRGEAEWIGALTPWALGETYCIRVRFKSGKAPRVHVVEPQLRPREPGGQVPHTYSGNALCLYRPRNREWNSSLAIAETIIPWSCEWLYFYEVWLVTGEWLGGGEHPTSRGKTKRARR